MSISAIARRFFLKLDEMFFTPVLEIGKIIYLEEGMFTIQTLDYTMIKANRKNGPIRVEAIVKPFHVYTNQGYIAIEKDKYLIVNTRHKEKTPMIVNTYKLSKATSGNFFLLMDESY